MNRTYHLLIKAELKTKCGMTHLALCHLRMQGWMFQIPALPHRKATCSWPEHKKTLAS